jgi:excisionase family DNA binding protein
MGTAPRRQRKEPVTTTVLPTFLTARQVADMLQVDERTVLRWAQHDASMPATRLGRVVRFEREPLLRWLSRKQQRFAGSRRQVSMPHGSGAA